MSDDVGTAPTPASHHGDIESGGEQKSSLFKRKVGKAIQTDAYLNEFKEKNARPGGLDRDQRQRAMMALVAVTLFDNMCGALMVAAAPTLVTVGKHPDSFPNIYMGFSMAVNLWQSSYIGGQAISAFVLVPLSDKVGRVPILLICMIGGGVATFIKWICKFNFLAYLAANVLTGCVGCSASIASVYIGDVFEEQAEQTKWLGIMMLVKIMALTLGTMTGTALAPVGLWSPLFVGVGLSFFGAFLIFKFVPEPVKENVETGKKEDGEGGEDGNVEKPLDKGLAALVLGGSVLDNIGNTGLAIALNTVMVTTYALSASEYGTVMMFLIFTIFFGVAAGQSMIKKCGMVFAAVFGNFMTAISQLALLLIIKQGAALGWFITSVYIGYAFGLTSNIAMAPMVLAIAPPSQRGLVVGVFGAVSNVARCVGPLILAQVYDSTDGEVTLVVTAAFSLSAVFVSLLLMLYPVLSLPKQSVVPEQEYTFADDLTKEDFYWFTPAQNGAYKKHCIAKGIPYEFPLLKCNKYADDVAAGNLARIRESAKGNFAYIIQHCQNILADVLDDPKKKEAQVAEWRKFQDLSDIDEATQAEMKSALGAWMFDYFIDAGYIMKFSPVMYQSIIMNSMPPVGKTSEIDVVEVCKNLIAIFQNHADVEAKNAMHELNLGGV